MPQVIAASYNLGKSGRSIASKNRIAHFNTTSIVCTITIGCDPNNVDDYSTTISCNCFAAAGYDMNTACSKCT